MNWLHSKIDNGGAITCKGRDRERSSRGGEVVKRVRKGGILSKVQSTAQSS